MVEENTLLKKGFKKTEVGIIPVEWEVKENNGVI